jgi:hypothetical protein
MKDIIKYNNIKRKTNIETKIITTYLWGMDVLSSYLWNQSWLETYYYDFGKIGRTEFVEYNYINKKEARKYCESKYQFFVIGNISAWLENNRNDLIENKEEEMEIINQEPTKLSLTKWLEEGNGLPVCCDWIMYDGGDAMMICDLIYIADTKNPKNKINIGTINPNNQLQVCVLDQEYLACVKLTIEKYEIYSGKNVEIYIDNRTKDENEFEKPDFDLKDEDNHVFYENLIAGYIGFIFLCCFLGIGCYMLGTGH